MFKRIKEDVELYYRYDGIFGGVWVVCKAIGKIVLLPFALFGKLYEWVYYDESSNTIDKIYELVKWGR